MQVKLPGRYALVFAIVVVLLIVCAVSHAGDAARHLPGFWVGDPAFLDEGGLVDMFLQIEPPSTKLFDRLGGRARFEASLLMSTEAGIICNQGLTIRPKFGHGLRRKDEYDCAARVAFDDPEECPLLSDPGQRTLQLTFSPVRGTLALHDDDRLLAYLVKDSGASAALQAA